MFKNREFKVYVCYSILVILMGLATGGVYPERWPIVFFIFIMLLAAGNIAYIYYRYLKIKELSVRLRKISNGNFKLDVQDNREGELGILESEVYKMTLMLTEQAELLKKDKRYLADAVSDISHQLKTPLTSMMVMADLLGEEDLPAENRLEFNNRLHSQLVKTEWLIATLLKMSKLDANAVLMKKAPYQASQLIRQAAEQFLVIMDIRDQTFQAEGEEGVSVIGDLNWMSEAFSNLIKNCLEHTPEKGLIQVRYEENSIYTQFLITDTGAGIDRQDLPHIFERFYKGKNSSGENAGIGLALAKQIILLQGGTIEAGNRVEGGAYFLVKLYKQQTYE